MPRPRPLIGSLHRSMIQEVPAYANKFFYSLGFLSMTSFLLLIITGSVMALFGPDWWLTAGVGKYFRSIHLWATQAFVLFILLHLCVVFFTSGFKKPRRLTWVIGALMFGFALMEAEFGYVLRGDYSSQWRSLQGADFYNGTGLGWWINNLNYQQIYGIHLVLIPLLIIGLLGLHYLLVRVLGIAKPYRKDYHAPTVKANHTILFVRGALLVGLILVLSAAIPSPFIKPETVKSVAQADPKMVANTLVAEFDRSSDTAGYMDSINPYTFDTRDIFINKPYAELAELQHYPNEMQVYYAEPQSLQDSQFKQTADYFDKSYPDTPADKSNPLELAFIQLTDAAKAGLYQPALNSLEKNGDHYTYGLRFLADTGVMDSHAEALNITTEQYGMLREESGRAPGAWWLAPIGLMNHTILANDDNGDRDGAAILGLFLLLLIAFPFIPIANRIPDWLHVWRLIWGKSIKKT